MSLVDVEEFVQHWGNALMIETEGITFRTGAFDFSEFSRELFEAFQSGDPRKMEIVSIKHLSGNILAWPEFLGFSSEKKKPENNEEDEEEFDFQSIYVQDDMAKKLSERVSIRTYLLKRKEDIKSSPLNRNLKMIVPYPNKYCDKYSSVELPPGDPFWDEHFPPHKNLSCCCRVTYVERKK